MTITKKQEGDASVLVLEGRVDVNSSGQLQDAILHEFQSVTRLVLDMSEISYVSSAGLRALLIGQKTALSKHASFQLAHVTPDVMQLLHSSGFTRVLSILPEE